eukprot:6348848-Prymnesium_polylepis.1
MRRDVAIGNRKNSIDATMSDIFSRCAAVRAENCANSDAAFAKIIALAPAPRMATKVAKRRCERW